MVSNAVKDLYQLLGVGPNASHAEIKKAYRKLACTTHPDKNPGNTKSTAQFEKLSEAYRTLTDPIQRSKYDRSIDQQKPIASDRSTTSATWKSSLREFVNQLKQTSGPWPKKGPDLLYHLHISLLDSCKGGAFFIESLNVRVSLPAGVEPGAKISLPSQGGPGRDGGPSGNLIVVVHVTNHPWLKRQGFDLVCKRPVPFSTIILGNDIQVPTLQGIKTFTIPPRTNPEIPLRIKGMGVSYLDGTSRGDLLIDLAPEVPKEITKPAIKSLETFVRKMGKHNYPETQEFETMMQSWTVDNHDEPKNR